MSEPSSAAALPPAPAAPPSAPPAIVDASDAAIPVPLGETPAEVLVANPEAPPMPSSLPAHLSGTVGSGSWQSPCFGYAGRRLFIPAGPTVHVIDGFGEGAAPPALATRPGIDAAALGLSQNVQAVACDTALRRLFIGDQNGRQSRVVAVDPDSFRPLWATQEGELNSCLGLAALPQQSVVFASSLGEVHARDSGDGAPVSTFRGATEPTFLAADAATATLYVSCQRKSGGGAAAAAAGRGCAVEAFRWDGVRRALAPLGELKAADAAPRQRPLAFVPAPVVGAARGGAALRRGGFLVVGTLGEPTLLVLSVPDHRLVLRYAVPGPARVVGLSADPGGSMLAVVDALSRATLVLRWPLPGLVPQQAGAGAGGDDGAGSGADGFICMDCRQATPGAPAGSCDRCAPPSSSLLVGWLCARCLQQHELGERGAKHAAAARPCAPGLRVPLALDLSGGPAAAALTPFSPFRPGPLPCVSPGPAPALFVPSGPSVSVFDADGSPRPGISMGAVGLSPGGSGAGSAGSVVACAFDAPSQTLFVSDGAMLAAWDHVKRGARWVAAVPGGCSSLCVLPGSDRHPASLLLVAARDPPRLCSFRVEDGAQNPGAAAHRRASAAASALSSDVAEPLVTLHQEWSVWGVTADARTGAVYADVRRPAPARSSAAPVAAAPASLSVVASPAASPLPLSPSARSSIAEQHAILAFRWLDGGGGGGSRVRLELERAVDVPTDSRSALPRPLVVVPPSPGHHTSFLVIAGTVGDHDATLHVLSLPDRALVHSEVLDGLRAVHSLAADPSGGAIVVVGEQSGGPPGLRLRCLAWPPQRLVAGGGARTYEELLRSHSAAAAAAAAAGVAGGSGRGVGMARRQGSGSNTAACCGVQ